MGIMVSIQDVGRGGGCVVKLFLLAESAPMLKPLPSFHVLAFIEMELLAYTPVFVTKFMFDFRFSLQLGGSHIT